MVARFSNPSNLEALLLNLVAMISLKLVFKAGYSERQLGWQSCLFHPVCLCWSFAIMNRGIIPSIHKTIRSRAPCSIWIKKGWRAKAWNNKGDKARDSDIQNRWCSLSLAMIRLLIQARGIPADCISASGSSPAKWCSHLPNPRKSTNVITSLSYSWKKIERRVFWRIMGLKSGIFRFFRSNLCAQDQFCAEWKINSKSNRTPISTSSVHSSSYLDTQTPSD